LFCPKDAASQRRAAVAFLFFLCVLTLFVVKPPIVRADDNSARPGVIRYSVSLAHPEKHIVHVTIDIPPGASEHDLQLPVWNALYQVRDFSQYVNWVNAKDSTGRPLAMQLLDKSRWHVNGTESGAEIEYEILANNPGPYGAQLNEKDAFFNLAEILMYPVDLRPAATQLRFRNIPPGWRIATALAASSKNEFAAANYDLLVDAPVEIGTFRERDFDQGGGHYRVVVDADPADYDMEKLVPTVRRIVTAATTWMNDRPFDTYLFLYHFPREPGGGGMEHAYSTAIDVNSSVVAHDPQAFADVTAHEFFHLWNVKRIRPQSLEPVDYTKENYTNALWFSEGVTNTVQDYVCLQAGLLDEPHYLSRLAGEIGELERRPAHRTQSAEQASLDAWLEKYPSYLLPDRSISYYNKGDLLGVLLDLTVRDASHGAASLRDLLQWLNQNYAQKGRFFPDSDGVRQAAEAIGHVNLEAFFQKYVAGTEEIPWDDFLKGVGLHLVRHASVIAELGFWAVRNSDAPPAVSWLDPDGEAVRAGLAVDDSILEINGRVTSSDFRQQLAEVPPGSMLHLRVRRGASERQIAWRVGSHEDVEFELKDLDAITQQQKARRAAWLSGQDQSDRDQSKQDQSKQDQSKQDQSKQDQFKQESKPEARP
jgi:predicted metalloprotease with PDZ domain